VLYPLSPTTAMTARKEAAAAGERAGRGSFLWLELCACEDAVLAVLTGPGV